MPELSRRVQTFTDSVIRRMTRINNMTPGSINLSQGFPDFDPPQEILDALKEAAEHGPHQYSITFGAKNFRDALAEMYTKKFAREIDPEKEIVVTCGGTEAMMAAMMTVCNQEILMYIEKKNKSEEYPTIEEIKNSTEFSGVETWQIDQAIEELKNLTSILGDKNSLIKVDHDGRLESLC